MSNIFEIDGEIEDNDDDNGKKKGKPEEESADPSADQSNDGDNAADGNDVPWYDRVLSEDDEDESGDSLRSESEEENTSFSLDDRSDIEEEETADDSNDGDYSDEITIDEPEEYEEEEEEEAEEKEFVMSDEEEDEEDEEHFDEIFPRREKKPLNIWTAVFAFLFLACLSLLGYFQFYDGNSFTIDLKHKGTATAIVNDSLEVTVNRALERNEQLKSKIEDLTITLREVNERIEEIRAGGTYSGDSSLAGRPGTTAGTLDRSGTKYYVQLIALRYFEPELDGNSLFLVKKEANGLSKLMVGALESEGKAKMIYKNLRASGFKDAFIVKEVDGKQVDYRIED